MPVREVAELWRCSRDHVYDLITAGQLRVVNLGRGRAKTRIPESELAAFVRRHARNARLGADHVQPLPDRRDDRIPDDQDGTRWGRERRAA